MKNHHEVGHFKSRMMILLLSLAALMVMAGQSLAATCSTSTCHGLPPLDSADGKRHPDTGAFAGNHSKHVGAPNAPGECVKCHSSAAGYDNKHAATSTYKISLSTKINSYSTARYSKGVFFNQTSVPVMGTCSNVNCHFEKNASNRTPAPVWGSTATRDCSFCHDSQPVTGSHAKHEAKYGGTGSCVQCHPNYGTTSFNHATSAGKHKIVTSTFLTYSGGTTTSWLPTQSTSFGSCRATTCHDTGRNNPRTPVWGTSKATCAACHEVSPTTFSHQKHLTGLAGNFNRNAVCGDCHAGYTQGTEPTPAAHIDGNVDVTNALELNFGYPQNKAKGSAPSSCSTSKCHSDGNSNYSPTPPTWGGASTGCTFCHPNLKGKHSIHVKLSALASATYASTADNSAGTTYDFGCANCHPNAASNHLNGTVDVTLNSTQGGPLKSKNNTVTDSTGYTQNLGVSVTCAASYCHSNGMATPTFYGNTFDWYEGAYAGDKCARCHGNSPNTGGRVGSAAHSAHVVGIHVDDIFNGVSKKLPIGGGNAVNAAHGRNNRSTTINCNICHALTVNSFNNDQNSECSLCHKVGGNPAPLMGNASIADTSKHINGVVDVVFINQKIATKAQVAQSAFAAYTASTTGGWSRNKNIFKTYTSGYDVTKATLFAGANPYSTGSGCLNIACHANIAVKWTDAVTCTSCHTRLK